METKQIDSYLSSIFKDFKKKPILFVGSGLSRRYLGLPDWKNLLIEFTKRIRPSDVFAFRYYENKALRELENKNLPESYLLPMIAELLEVEYNSIFFDNPSFDHSIKIDYKDDILRGHSPFRLAVCDHLKSLESHTDAYHREKTDFLRLKDKISNCITTNYDTFLEDSFPEYLTLVGQNDLLNKNVGSVGIIYKIHGSIANPQSLVLTSSDYEEFEAKLKYLSAKLLTHFIEFPIIFVGYGANDSNIRAILKDIKICLTPESSNRMSRQLIFVDHVDDAKMQNIVATEIEDIQMTKLLLNDFSILYKAFDNIVDTIDVKTLRQVESKISQLIQSTNVNVDRVYATDLENEKLGNEDLAIYIGHNSSVFSLGYEGIRLINICEDILFNSKSYDAFGILNSTIPSQKPFYSRRKVPLHKYLNQVDIQLDPFYKKSNLIISDIDDIYNKHDKKTRLYRYPISDLSKIIGTSQNLNTKIDNIYYSLRALPIDEVKEYIKSIWSRKDEISPITHLTKIICVIDLVENKTEKSSNQGSSQ